MGNTLPLEDQAAVGMNTAHTTPALSRTELPRMCAELPVCGGYYKTVPEDFRVDELPAGPWAGKGDYLVLQIETRLMATNTLCQHLQHTMGVPWKAIRVAGRKDKRAVTSQWVSIEQGDEEVASRLEQKPLRPGQSIRVLGMARHTEPMSFGVHGGNRFCIVLRDIPPAQFEASWLAAKRITQRLQDLGIPNFYGEQRIGYSNPIMGRELLLQMDESTPHHIARFLISSYQAQLFNHYLAGRMARGLWRTVLPGDWMREQITYKRPQMALCTVQTQRHWQLSYNQLTYSVTAPLFGRHISLAGGTPGRWERQLLQQEGLTLEDFYNEELHFPNGSRRSIRLPVQELTLRRYHAPAHIQLDFVLPPGGYATTVLHELGAQHAQTH